MPVPVNQEIFTLKARSDFLAIIVLHMLSQILRSHKPVAATVDWTLMPVTDRTWRLKILRASSLHILFRVSHEALLLVLGELLVLDRRGLQIPICKGALPPFRRWEKCVIWQSSSFGAWQTACSDIICLCTHSPVGIYFIQSFEAVVAHPYFPFVGPFVCVLKVFMVEGLFRGQALLRIVFKKF
jgi:hypothetical protein